MVPNVQPAASAGCGNVAAGTATRSFMGIFVTAVQKDTGSGAEGTDQTAHCDKADISGPAVNSNRKENKSADLPPVAIATAAPVLIPPTPLPTAPAGEAADTDSAAAKPDAASSETGGFLDCTNEPAFATPDRLIVDSSNAAKTTGRFLDRLQHLQRRSERSEKQTECNSKDVPPRTPVSGGTEMETPARLPDQVRVPPKEIQAFTVDFQAALSYQNSGRAVSRHVFQTLSEDCTELAKYPEAAITLGGDEPLLPNCIQSPNREPTFGGSSDQTQQSKLHPAAPFQSARETIGGEIVVAGAQYSRNIKQRSGPADVKDPAAMADPVANQVPPTQLQASPIHCDPSTGRTDSAVSPAPVHAPVIESNAPKSISTGASTQLHQPAKLAFSELRPDLGAAHLVTRLEHQELRFGWNSPDFGRIEVRTTVEHNRVNAVISVPDSQLRDSLQAELGSLHRALADHSLELSHFSTDSGASRNAPHDAEPEPYTNHPIWNTEREREVSAPQVSIAIGAHIGLLDLRA